MSESATPQRGEIFPSMTVTYENSKPIELADLTTSLQALSRRFSRFAAQNDLQIEDETVKLFIKEIRPGSVIVELVNLVTSHATASSGLLGVGLGATVTQANSIITFAKSIGDGLSKLAGKGGSSKDIPTSELRDLAKIVEPIARDSGGQLHIEAKDSSQIQVSINLQSNDANAVQNRSLREIESRRAPMETNFKKVLMYWDQASKGKASSRSDKALIDKICDRPLKVIFDDDQLDIKSKMVSGRDNPFNIGFIVDVELLTRGERPVAYRVTHLYEVLDDEEDAGGEPEVVEPEDDIEA